MGIAPNAHDVALQKAAQALSALESFDRQSRELLSEIKDPFEVNGQTAAFMVVDLWGRRLAAEELLKLLKTTAATELKVYEAGLATLRSSLQEILTGYLGFGTKSGKGALFLGEAGKIADLLNAVEWPSDRSILDYLRAC